ncbi:MAG: hypothetical protein GF364_02800 [Candidatus Lokiarchaeota archaeon]|nr:hypothetical protein [Candidatus Lokiarchaeota archaeon]
MSNIKKVTLEMITDFIDEVTPTIRNQNAIGCIEKGPVLYVGDVHGFFRNIKYAVDLAKKLEVAYLVFLGDYTDRGPFQVECLLNVLYMYSRSLGFNERKKFVDISIEDDLPFHTIMLKGNHEDTRINKMYGFKTEVRERISDGKFPERKLDELYGMLPVAVETKWKTLALHGGIPKPLDPDKPDYFLQILRDIKLPLTSLRDPTIINKAAQLIYQITWNDPNENIVTNDVPIFQMSFRGPNIYQFNRKALESFFKKSGLKRLVRAHESVRGAYQVLWDEQFIHVFSAYPYYDRIDTPAFYLEYEDGSGKFIDQEGEILRAIKKIE